MNSFSYTEDSKFYDIETHGITISSAMHSKIKKKLERLIEQSPSRAFATLEISTKNNELFGTLKIESFKRNFAVEYKHSNLDGLISGLEKSLTLQLKEWKKTRFLDLDYNDQGIFSKPTVC